MFYSRGVSSSQPEVSCIQHVPLGTLKQEPAQRHTAFYIFLQVKLNVSRLQCIMKNYWRSEGGIPGLDIDKKRCCIQLRVVIVLACCVAATFINKDKENQEEFKNDLTYMTEPGQWPAVSNVTTRSSFCQTNTRQIS